MAAATETGLLTLLFLGAVGVPRTWDLRGYTADGLSLLTGRTRAYGYRYTEAFLSRGAPVPMEPNVSPMPLPAGPRTSGTQREKPEKLNTPMRSPAMWTDIASLSTAMRFSRED